MMLNYRYLANSSVSIAISESLFLTPLLIMGIQCISITALFNNVQTLHVFQKFKAQQTNAFCTTANQMFGSSSQLPTTAEHTVIKSLCTVQTTKWCSAVVVCWEDPLNIWLMHAFVSQPSKFRVPMFLKSAVTFFHYCGLVWECGSVVWVLAYMYM